MAYTGKVGIGSVTDPDTKIEFTCISCEVDNFKGYFVGSHKSERKLLKAAMFATYSGLVKKVDIKWDEPWEFIADDNTLVKGGGHYTAQLWF